MRVRVRPQTPKLFNRMSLKARIYVYRAICIEVIT